MLRTPLAPDARIILTDFDGTFADYAYVPPAHIDAVARARENGHVVLLCTGRPLSMIPGESQQLFDGVVSSAGARVDIGGQTLVDEVYPPQLGRRTVELLRRHESVFLLEAAEAVYGPPGTLAALERRLQVEGGSQRNASSILAALVEREDLEDVAFAKATVWSSLARVADIAEELGPEVRVLTNSVTMTEATSGELQLTAIDKADGLRLVAEHLGVDISRTVALGDGMNDIGMLEIAGTAVAIEGGDATLIGLADLVVPPPSGDGFAKALAQLGLI